MAIDTLDLIEFTTTDTDSCNMMCYYTIDGDVECIHATKDRPLYEASSINVSCSLMYCRTF